MIRFESERAVEAVLRTYPTREAPEDYRIEPGIYDGVWGRRYVSCNPAVDDSWMILRRMQKEIEARILDQRERARIELKNTTVGIRGSWCQSGEEFRFLNRTQLMRVAVYGDFPAMIGTGDQKEGEGCEKDGVQELQDF